MKIQYQKFQKLKKICIISNIINKPAIKIEALNS